MAQLSRLEKDASEGERAKLDFNAEIGKLEERIKEQDNQVTELRIANQKLQFELQQYSETVVAKVDYEKVQSALAIVQGELVFKSGRLND
jgi:predicted  nucleic acid-binding Zn-ribbon protein